MVRSGHGDSDRRVQLAARLGRVSREFGVSDAGGVPLGFGRFSLSDAPRRRIGADHHRFRRSTSAPWLAATTRARRGDDAVRPASPIGGRTTGRVDSTRVRAATVDGRVERPSSAARRSAAQGARRRQRRLVRRIAAPRSNAKSATGREARRTAHRRRSRLLGRTISAVNSRRQTSATDPSGVLPSSAQASHRSPRPQATE